MATFQLELVSPERLLLSRPVDMAVTVDEVVALVPGEE